MAEEAPAAPRKERENAQAKAVMVLVLLGVVLFSISQAVPWYAPVGGGETTEGIAEALFDTYVVAFEVLGVLLLGALLGAMYMAFKEERA